MLLECFLRALLYQEFSLQLIHTLLFIIHVMIGEECRYSMLNYGTHNFTC